MADEAKNVGDFGYSRYQADGTVTPYEVRQGPTGEAEVYDTFAQALAGTYPIYRTRGRYTIQKTSGITILKGGRVYWDYSENLAHFKAVYDRDFYLGRATEDAASTAPTVVVDLNIDPRYDIDLARDGFQSVLVGTPAAGGFGYPVNLGGALIFELSATSEAQKVDALGVQGFSPDANAICEFVFRVLDDGASGTQDISIGVANETHASDFQTVAQQVSIHLDGNVTAINAQSDDGVTDVAPTDTTKVYTLGTALASRAEVWIDMRNKADVQIYVEGVLVNDATTFTLASAAGPLFPIVHVEKASGTDVYKIAVDRHIVRFAEQ